MDAAAALVVAHLEHEVDGAGEGEEGGEEDGGGEGAGEAQRARDAEDKADQVGAHHAKDVEGTGEGAQMAVVWFCLELQGDGCKLVVDKITQITGPLLHTQITSLPLNYHWSSTP